MKSSQKMAKRIDLIAKMCKTEAISMRMKVVFLLGLGMFAIPSWGGEEVDTNEVVVADAPRDMKLFLLVGQSNMAGRGTVSEEDAKPIARCLKLNRDGKWAEASTPLHFNRATSGYGIANTFVLRYLVEHPADTVGLIPCAVV